MSTKKYFDGWEETLLLLLSQAPKRADQATPLISYYLIIGNDKGVKRVCDYINRNTSYLGYCDLALGAVYIKEGLLEKGLIYIRKANDMGVLDSEDVDKETSKYLKGLIKEGNR